MSGFVRFSVTVAAGMSVLTTGALSAAEPSEATPSQEPQEAPPEEPFPSPDFPFRLEATGGGAFGDTQLSTGESVNAYGPGLGLRASYAFDFGGTLGLRYDHFFGTTSSYPVPLVALIEYQTGASLIAADAGFELAISHALFRPHVGVGLLGRRTSVTCSPVSGSFGALAQDLCDQNDDAQTSWGFAAVPGLLMGLGWSRYYGFVDIQYYLRDEANAFGIAGGVGITL